MMRYLHLGSWNGVSGARWAPLFLRLVVGYGFVQHGVAKLFEGTWRIRWYPAGPRCTVPSCHGMGDDCDGVVWRHLDLCGAFVTLVSLPMAVLLVVAIL